MKNSNQTATTEPTKYMWYCHKLDEVEYLVDLKEDNIITHGGFRTMMAIVQEGQKVVSYANLSYSCWMQLHTKAYAINPYNPKLNGYNPENSL